jgi:hypothetical protein
VHRQIAECGGDVQADWVVLHVYSPGREPEPGGVFLLTNDTLYFKLNDKLESTDSAVLEVWQEMAADLELRVTQSGGVGVLKWLETTASNVFRLTDRRHIPIRDRDPQDVLNELYRDQILTKIRRASS